MPSFTWSDCFQTEDKLKKAIEQKAPKKEIKYLQNRLAEITAYCIANNRA